MSRVLPIVCCFGLSIGAIGVENVEDAALRSIGPAAIRAHVAFLADDLLEGRGTGTRGHDFAAQYVAAPP